MFEENLYKLLIAIVKQAYRDAANGNLEALLFIKYLQGEDVPAPCEQLNLFS